MSKWVWICALSAMALALGGCEGGQQPAGGKAESAPQATADSKKLAELFDPDNLGTRVAWFDKNFNLTVKRITPDGPGYHKREYALGQCSADVEEKDGNIVAITAYASEAGKYLRKAIHRALCV